MAPCSYSSGSRTSRTTAPGSCRRSSAVGGVDLGDLGLRLSQQLTETGHARNSPRPPATNPQSDRNPSNPINNRPIAAIPRRCNSQLLSWSAMAAGQLRDFARRVARHLPVTRAYERRIDELAADLQRLASNRDASTTFVRPATTTRPTPTSRRSPPAAMRLFAADPCHLPAVDVRWEAQESLFEHSRNPRRRRAVRRGPHAGFALPLRQLLLRLRRRPLPPPGAALVATPTHRRGRLGLLLGLHPRHDDRLPRSRRPRDVRRALRRPAAIAAAAGR